MQKEIINILVIDNENEFFDFVKECITLEAISFYGDECECLEIDHEKGDDNLSLDYDIYVVVERDNNENSEEQILYTIDKIRNNRGFSPHIFVVTRNNNPVLLKKLISLNIQGIIDKDEKDCSVLAKSMHKAFETRVAICKICELKEKIEKE